MKVYLINWRQETFDWNFKDKTMFWSTGNNKSLQQGDIVFLVKQGKAPCGLVAMGKVVSNVVIRAWNFKNRLGPGVKIRFVEKYRPTDKCIVEMELLKRKFVWVNWSTQNCIMIPEDVVDKLFQLWSLKKIMMNLETEIEKL